MATSKEYFDFVTEQLAQIDGISYRAMMGEYIVYCKAKVVGGIYDDRLMVKPTKSARKLLPHAPSEEPYAGAKQMIVVEDLENKSLLSALFNGLYEELPAPKMKK